MLVLYGAAIFFRSPKTGVQRMSLFKTFETDEKKETEGVEVEGPPNDDSTVPVFVLASMGRANKKYAKALDKATKPFRGNLQSMGNDFAEKIFMEIFVSCVLKDWRNVQDRDGSTITFSEPNAIELFKKLPRLYDFLQTYAQSSELFKDEAREEEAKNL